MVNKLVTHDSVRLGCGNHENLDRHDTLLIYYDHFEPRIGHNKCCRLDALRSNSGVNFGAETATGMATDCIFFYDRNVDEIISRQGDFRHDFWGKIGTEFGVYYDHF